MKKLFLSLILLTTGLFLISQTYDVTISGLVTNMATGEPVADQEVNIISDSLAGGSYLYYNTVATDNSGYYMDIMPIPVGEQGFVEVYTMSCGTMLTQTGTFSATATQLNFDFQLCDDTLTGCEAMFYYHPGTSQNAIQFDDESFGDPTSWTWDFGDGNTSNEQNPEHLYAASGEYNVSLLIEGDSNQCFSTYGTLVFVGDSIWPTGCEAMFYYHPGFSQNAIQFVDESYGYPDTWSWDFGDGNFSNEQNPEHFYAASGEYLVSLIIEGDSNQCYSMFEEIVYVGDSIWPTDCEAMFFYYPDSSELITINFVDMSIAGGNQGGTSGIPDTWYWDFGDGNTSSMQNPVHTYVAEGEYQVCLTITDSLGSCQSTFCDIVYAGNWIDDCEAYYWYFPEGDSNYPGGGWNSLNISFFDASMGNPDTWYWEFGDGTTSTEQNPVHMYSEEGTYTVCLSISNTIDSCESIYCEEVYIFNDTIAGCNAWYEYQINNLTIDLQAFLEGGSDNVDYVWDFGDDNSSIGQSVSHTYSEDGIYEVKVTAMDSSGCYSEYVELIWVGDDFTFGVDGYVFLDDSLMADFADVHLMTFDTIENGLINIATTQIDANGYYSFDGVGIENCMYFVQAELTSTSAYYGSYVPTYHLDAVSWEFAWPVFPEPMGMSYNIFMIPTSSSGSGSGIISGVVSNQGSRDVMSNIEIILLDSEGNPIAYLKTDDQGMFSFSGLPNGIYTVYTEITGIETIPFDVTLSDENNNSSVNILVTNGQAILGIDDITSVYIKSVESIYPNPVTNNAKVNVSIKESSNIRVEILNHFGQVLYSNEQYLTNGKHSISLPSESFSQGLYFVKIAANDNVGVVRKFIKLR
jgi:PKD repeat protein